MCEKTVVNHAWRLWYLVFVQQRLADDVLADGRRWSQTVQPVKQVHAGNVLLSPLCVQLTPQYLRHPLSDNKQTNK